MAGTGTSARTYITDEQLESFDRDGYVILPGVFNDDEIARMRREADFILELILNSSIANQRRSGRLDWMTRPDGVQLVRKIQPINDLSLYLTQVSQDPRLIEPLRTIMGDDPVLMEEKLNYKQPLPTAVQGVDIRPGDGHFPIHNDWAYYAAQDYPQTVLSSAVSMDACTEQSGPLRVWPGSHRQHLEHGPSTVGLEVLDGLIDKTAGRSVLAPAGSVMIFHVLLVHNSRPNMTADPRRLMIYSHYPKAANKGIDIRNGPGRLRESPYEMQYLRAKLAGRFTDVFKAP